MIFYKEFETDPHTDDENDNGKRQMTRASSVFNAQQVDGYEPPAAPASLGPVERLCSRSVQVSSDDRALSHPAIAYAVHRDFCIVSHTVLFAGPVDVIY